MPRTRSTPFRLSWKCIVLILATITFLTTGCQTLVSSDVNAPASGRNRLLFRSTAEKPLWGVDPRAKTIERNLDSIEHALP